MSRGRRAAQSRVSHMTWHQQIEDVVGERVTAWNTFPLRTLKQQKDFVHVASVNHTNFFSVV